MTYNLTNISKIIHDFSVQPFGVKLVIGLSIGVFAFVAMFGVVSFSIVMTDGFTDTGSPGRFDFESFILLLACCVLVIVGISGWWDGNRRMRHARDTPTAKIRSAAQGYVELKGTLIRAGGQPPLKSPLSHTDCLWWEYKIQENDGRNLYTIEEGRGSVWMCLEDDTGQCFINPGGAHIRAHQRKVWDVKIPESHHTPLGKAQKAGTYRCTEHLLFPGRELYAIGDFRSINGKHILAATDDDDLRPFILSGEGEIEMIFWARLEALSGAICCLGGAVGAVALLSQLWQHMGWV